MELMKTTGRIIYERNCAAVEKKHAQSDERTFYKPSNTQNTYERSLYIAMADAMYPAAAEFSKSHS